MFDPCNLVVSGNYPELCSPESKVSRDYLDSVVGRTKILNGIKTENSLNKKTSNENL